MFKERQAVKHKSRKLHDARFSGYTKSGRVKVIHNAAHPYGVTWAESAFKAENITLDHARLSVDDLWDEVGREGLQIHSPD